MIARAAAAASSVFLCVPRGFAFFFPADENAEDQEGGRGEKGYELTFCKRLGQSASLAL